MASFEQHVNGAVIATGVLIVPLHSAGLLDGNQSLIALSLGLLGGVLPDIDSDNSKPLQVIFKLTSIFFPLVIVLSFFGDAPLLYLMGYWILSSLILQVTIFKVFVKLSIHRGVIHSIPMGILFGQVTAYLFYTSFGYTLVFSTIAGLFLSFGFMIHLLLDELVSLNAFGLKVKKSLGTAFKLYDKRNLAGTLVLYMLIVSFYLFFPIKVDIFIEIFEVIKNVKVM